MNRRENGEREDAKVTSLGETPPSADLRYEVELWNLARTARERVIGRAAGVVLARAIFAAAQTEHLGRKIVLRRGDKVLDETD